MLITRTSAMSGTTRTLDLPISEAQYVLWSSGLALIQDAFPHLSASDREFLKTGITSEEWDAMFAEEE